MGRKIVLGLSGGVDSAVAATLLKRGGYDVFGLYLDIGAAGGVGDAQAAAAALGVGLEVRDIRAELEAKVCAPFVAAYLRGETPNPCIMCNPAVKLAALCGFADELGAEFIATGHYARAENGRLYKGCPANDQSYMLCRIEREQLNRLVLPLGGYEKAQVRELARELGLAVAAKPDSMEICFIPDNDYGAYIESRGDYPPEGSFVDETGRVLGRHRGIHRYTLGQRRGLRIALGRRMFVSEIRPESNEIVLSEGEGLFTTRLRAGSLRFHGELPESFDCAVKVRHSRNETAATVLVEDGVAEVSLREPVRAPTAGQGLALYDGELLLGGGVIL